MPRRKSIKRRANKYHSLPNVPLSTAPPTPREQQKDYKGALPVDTQSHAIASLKQGKKVLDKKSFNRLKNKTKKMFRIGKKSFNESSISLYDRIVNNECPTTALDEKSPDDNSRGDLNERSYPIDTPGRARKSLSRGSRYLSRDKFSKLAKKVNKRYGLKPNKKILRKFNLDPSNYGHESSKEENIAMSLYDRVMSEAEAGSKMSGKPGRYSALRLRKKKAGSGEHHKMGPEDAGAPMRGARASHKTSYSEAKNGKKGKKLVPVTKFVGDDDDDEDEQREESYSKKKGKRRRKRKDDDYMDYEEAAYGDDEYDDDDHKKDDYMKRKKRKKRRKMDYEEAYDDDDEDMKAKMARLRAMRGKKRKKKKSMNRGDHDDDHDDDYDDDEGYDESFEEAYSSEMDRRQAMGDSDAFFAWSMKRKPKAIKVRPKGSTWDYNPVPVKPDVDHGKVKIEDEDEDEYEEYLDDVTESLEQLRNSIFG